MVQSGALFERINKPLISSIDPEDPTADQAATDAALRELNYRLQRQRRKVRSAPSAQASARRSRRGHNRSLATVLRDVARREDRAGLERSDFAVRRVPLIFAWKSPGKILK